MKQQNSDEVFHVPVNISRHVQEPVQATCDPFLLDVIKYLLYRR